MMARNFPIKGEKIKITAQIEHNANKKPAHHAGQLIKNGRMASSS